jgi:hypothetical protein
MAASKYTAAAGEDEHLPDLPWYIYAMLLAPLALVFFAALYKSLQVRAAAEWTPTPGKVITSDSQVRDLRVIDRSREDGYRFEPRNFANIVYAYSVNGEALTSNRVSIDDDRGDFGIAETIARYPVGTDVTVYYNPRHPREAVLERDTPKGWWGCLWMGMAIAFAIIFGSVFGLNRLTEFVSIRLGNPKLSPLVVVLGVFGCVILLFALAMRRQASLARQWPVVPGTIAMSDIEIYRASSNKNQVRGPRMYERQASFSYRFNNVAYSRVDARFATGVNSTRGWLARKFTKAYPDGAAVDVYVNPLNPSEATLDPRSGTGIIWLLWLLATAFGAAAYCLATRG